MVQDPLDALGNARNGIRLIRLQRKTLFAEGARICRFVKNVGWPFNSRRSSASGFQTEYFPPASKPFRSVKHVKQQ